MKKITAYFFLINLCFSFQVYFCKAQVGNLISGRYVNLTILDKIKDSIAGSVPVYCYEINFNGSDSAEIFNGFEEYKLGYKKVDNDFILINAFQGKDIPFMIYQDSMILLIDTLWTGSPGMSLFKKVNDGLLNNKKKWVIDCYINEQMIAGEYSLYEQNLSANQIITFFADGRVTGLNNYATYFICYSGDCVGETQPLSNLITFTTHSGEETSYAFKINKENESLSFYNIGPPIKDIKGEREILNIAFDLRKK